MIPTLIHILIVILILGLIFSLTWWALTYLPLQPPFASIVRFILILIFVLILIGLLWPLTGIKI